MSESSDDLSNFERGKKDCRDGVPHVDGQGESYDMGYRVEYSVMEALAALVLSRSKK